MADDIYKSTRYFLIYGRILGILPLGGLRQDSCKRLYFRRNTFASAVSLLIILILSLNGTLASFRVIREGKGSVYKIIATSVPAVFYTIGAYKFMFFLKNCGRLIDLFKMWNHVSLHIPSGDLNLTRDVNLIAAIFTAVSAIENVFSNLKYFGVQTTAEFSGYPANVTSLELFYLRTHRYLAEFIPFNPVLASYLILQNQWNDKSWNFADIFICIVARSLNFKLKAYLQNVKDSTETLEDIRNQSQGKIKNKARNGSEYENKCRAESNEQPQLYELNSTCTTATLSISTSTSWEQICHDYEMLGELVSGFRDLLSPLVFACYGSNIFFLSFEIWAIPTEKRLTFTFISTLWSAVISIVTVAVLNVQAARIHSYGQALGKLILQKCPLEFFPSKTSKIERILERNEMGLTGLGCFTITNTLLLHVIGVIFTIEVLLIQGQLRI